MDERRSLKRVTVPFASLRTTCLLVQYGQYSTVFPTRGKEALMCVDLVNLGLNP
jgi:hypothetical protein